MRNTKALAPIRRRIVVATDPSNAFRVFTDEIDQWWPTELRVNETEGTTVAFCDGQLLETAASGAQAVWGSVVEWQQGSSFTITWHPGTEPATATSVRMTFEPVDKSGSPRGHTLVTLEHDGWERTVDPDRRRAEYEQGWPEVMATFGARADKSAGGEQTWVALRHSPGPSAPAEGSLLAHPDFAEHLAFLERLSDRGVLVAAGPLAPNGQSVQSGMAVIRVPDGEVDAYVREAREEDQSVVRGLLVVDPVVWHVALSAGA
jgi:uncharacterized protein YciI